MDGMFVGTFLLDNSPLSLYLTGKRSCLERVTLADEFSNKNIKLIKYIKLTFMFERLLHCLPSQIQNQPFYENFISRFLEK